MDTPLQYLVSKVLEKHYIYDFYLSDNAASTNHFMTDSAQQSAFDTRKMRPYEKAAPAKG
ncbi:hypothetical protein OLMES_3574 [Oleiphilus messinensis]|uniref:Uncharacterized protein n=1 Tax=Oleiphilus messinensis TaxID=141451 RepID=A0A1Y0IE02_9GAMM|nr:hypothetical protein OLMES_3574 [Oleiphilus messinensis]